MAGSGSGTGTRSSDSGPALTIAELRDYLMDLTEYNDLLQDQEFETDDLEGAREDAVNRWNARAGLVLRKTYSVNTFPSEYVDPWKTGAAAYALRRKAFSYARNTFPYSAGGVTVQDKEGKTQAYLTLSSMLMQEYDAWMNGEVFRLNWAGAFKKLT